MDFPISAEDFPKLDMIFLFFSKIYRYFPELIFVARGFLGEMSRIDIRLS